MRIKKMLPLEVYPFTLKPLVNTTVRAKAETSHADFVNCNIRFVVTP